MKTFRRLVNIALEHKNLMAVSLLFGFSTIGSSVGLLMASAYIIARAALHPSIAVLQVAIVGVRFFGVLRGVSRYVERLVSHNVTFRLLAKFRVWFYKSIEPLAPAGLAKYRSGDLLARVVSDVESLEHIYIRVLFPPLVAAAISILMWVLFGIYGIEYSLLITVSLFVAAVFVPIITRKLSKKDGSEFVKTRSSLNVFSIDLSDGLTELIAFGNEKDFMDNYNKINNRFSSLQKRISAIDGLNETLIILVMNISILVVFFLAIPEISSKLTGIDLAVIVVGIMASFEAVLPIPTAVQHYEMSIKAADRIFEITDAEPTVDFTNAKITETESNSLKFENVSFAYKENNEVLKNLDLIIPENNHIAIVGASGAGKSTLANLLVRFYEPQAGNIYLGNALLSKLNENTLRNKITLVDQKPYFFNGTVKENLLIAKPDASDEELLSALRKANIEELVNSLPEGLSTYIGSKGFMLSGGERQRLAIARALLKKSPIMIFDEPTANLDTKNENEILNTIFSAAKDKTLILITHRLVQLDKVQRIIVMKKGEIIETGSFEELYSHKTEFRKMYDLQRNLLV